MKNIKTFEGFSELFKGSVQKIIDKLKSSSLEDGIGILMNMNAKDSYAFSYDDDNYEIYKSYDDSIHLLKNGEEIDKKSTKLLDLFQICEEEFRIRKLYPKQWLNKKDSNPKSVGGKFSMNGNKLDSLKGYPKRITKI